jgi:hypothetical protein
VDDAISFLKAGRIEGNASVSLSKRKSSNVPALKAGSSHFTLASTQSMHRSHRSRSVTTHASHTILAQLARQIEAMRSRKPAMLAIGDGRWRMAASSLKSVAAIQQCSNALTWQVNVYHNFVDGQFRESYNAAPHERWRAGESSNGFTHNAYTSARPG